MIVKFKSSQEQRTWTTKHMKWHQGWKELMKETELNNKTDTLATEAWVKVP